MKLINYFYTEEEAQELHDYLQANGIAAYIEDKSGKGNGLEWGVFVALDIQYHDAVMLLDNENHIVNHKVDVDNFNHFLEKNKNLWFPNIGLNNLMNYVVAALVVVVILVAIWKIWPHF